MLIISKPKDILELTQRYNAIAGKKISELAEIIQTDIPHDLKRVKGWLGDLIEIYLGADFNNKAEPDFAHLGIELKTLPLNKNNVPAESTYICTAPINNMELNWENSRVKKKLNKILWVPIESSKEIPIRDRKIGTPFLWQPTKEEEEILAKDWEELTNMLCLGEVESLFATYGTYLQIRPKAMHSRILVDTLNTNAELIFVVPKGFYLRASFTSKILKNMQMTIY